MFTITAIVTIIWLILAILCLVVRPPRKYSCLRFFLFATILLLPLQSQKGWAGIVLVPLLFLVIPLLLLAFAGMYRLATTTSPKLIFYSAWLLAVFLGLFYVMTISWGDSQDVTLLGFIPATTHDTATHVVSSIDRVTSWGALGASLFLIYALVRTRPGKQKKNTL